MRFDELDFNENLFKGIQDAGFETCTEVQKETFQFIAEEKDVLAQSQTGTGKTAAFLIGMFQLMLEKERFKGAKALVIVPTRELAIQVEREAKLLASHLDLKIGSFFGGVGYHTQEKQLKEGLDLMIGTPGRLIDFNKSKKLDLREIGILVIDEADRLFDMGFMPDITFMLKRMKPPKERLTMLYSATMSTRVANLSWEHMNEPGEIIIEPEQVTVDGVKQELYHVGANEKMALLLGLLKRDNPQSAVIFCNTRGKSYEVARRLEVNGYKVKYLIGDLPQKKRTQIVDAVKKGEIPFLVATDVAARGLHIDNLPLVVNYDVPNDAENYVHRIGRTARAGNQGRAVTLACEEYVLSLPAVEQYIDGKIPVVWADEDLYAQDESRGMSFPLNELKRNGTIRERDNRGGPSRKSQGGQRKGGSNQQRKPSPKVASAVAMAAGSSKGYDATAMESDSRKEFSSRKNKGQKGRNPSRDYKKSAQNQKGRQQRSRERIHEDKSISSESSLDSRLDYYRKKYGEDFKPTHVSEVKSKKSTKKKSTSKKKSGPKKAANTNKNNAPQQKNDNKKNEPQKKGFFSRLFGK